MAKLSLRLTERINSLLYNPYDLNESSIQRIKQHLASPRSFVMITGFRASYKDFQNRNRNKQLEYFVREKLGYGFFKMEGHYPEMPDEVETKSNDSNFENVSDTFTSGVRSRLKPLEPDNYGDDVKENSIFVIDNKNNPVKFREEMTELGAMFGQDSIFYKDPKGRCYFLYTRDVDGYYKGQRRKIEGELITDPEQIETFFSKLKGKKFTFSVR